MTLRRNRDFVLFQLGQLGSALGSSFTTVASPLLVLSLTGSPLDAGVVGVGNGITATVLVFDED